MQVEKNPHTYTRNEKNGVGGNMQKGNGDTDSQI